MPVRQPPRIQLAQTPTPLVRLERIERELGAAAGFWMKRDDLTGLELSGNKVRKLEYVTAAAIAAGCDTIVTEGTPQSNHCRATAAACARLGLRAHLLFRPPPAGPPAGNHLLDALFGATCSSWPRPEYSANRDAIIRSECEAIAARGGRPRFTPAGASEPLGCWGYIRCAAELAGQLYAAGISRCDVVTAISSGGTFAGLVLGQRLHRLEDWRVLAVPVSDDAEHHERETMRLCRETIEQFGLPIAMDDLRPAFIDGYVGDGYAVPYPAEIEAIRLLARTEGVVCDPVYTGKCLHAVFEGVRAGRLGVERPVVFLHTGGLFSNFAWGEALVQ